MVASKQLFTEPGNIRKFPGQYQQPPSQVPSPRRWKRTGKVQVRLQPQQPVHKVVLKEMVQMVREAVHQATAAAYAESVTKNLVSFSDHLNVYQMHAPREASDGDASVFLNSVEEWGGEFKADQVEQAMLMMGHSWKIIMQFAHTSAPSGREEEDTRLAQTWMLCRAGYAFGLLGVAELMNGPTMFDDREVMEAVFSDLGAFTRIAMKVAREASDLRHPIDEEPEDAGTVA